MAAALANYVPAKTFVRQGYGDSQNGHAQRSSCIARNQIKVYSLYPSCRHSGCGFILSSCSGDVTPHLLATPLFNRHVRKSAGALGMCASSLKGRHMHSSTMSEPELWDMDIK